MLSRLCSITVTLGFGWFAFFATVEPTVGGISISLTGDAHAQNCVRDPEDEREERRIPNMNLSTADKLGEIQELIDTENNPQAGIVELDRMIARGTRRYNGNELANIYKMLAYAYFILDDMDNTIIYNEKILALSGRSNRHVVDNDVHALSVVLLAGEVHRSPCNDRRLVVDRR